MLNILQFMGSPDKEGKVLPQMPQLPPAGKDAIWPPLPHQLREGNGTPLQDFCLENPMDGGAW